MRDNKATHTKSFNSRSREGSDLRLPKCVYSQDGFNSRSREGSDNLEVKTGSRKTVSIHAPARGATLAVR